MQIAANTHCCPIGLPFVRSASRLSDPAMFNCIACISLHPSSNLPTRSAQARRHGTWLAAIQGHHMQGMQGGCGHGTTHLTSIPHTCCYGHPASFDAHAYLPARRCATPSWPSGRPTTARHRRSQRRQRCLQQGALGRRWVGGWEIYGQEETPRPTAHAYDRPANGSGGGFCTNTICTRTTPGE